jgi:hypothetical protein
VELVGKRKQKMKDTGTAEAWRQDAGHSLVPLDLGTQERQPRAEGETWRANKRRLEQAAVPIV